LIVLCGLFESQIGNAAMRGAKPVHKFSVVTDVTVCLQKIISSFQSFMLRPSLTVWRTNFCGAAPCDLLLSVTALC
jgi:hypothetical protein